MGYDRVDCIPNLHTTVLSCRKQSLVIFGWVRSAAWYCLNAIYLLSRSPVFERMYEGDLRKITPSDAQQLNPEAIGAPV